MDKDKYTIDYMNKMDDLLNHLNNLEIIVKNSGSRFEGNSFYIDGTLDKSNELINKQINLYWVGSTAERRICEIGFNAGHSTLLMLLDQYYYNKTIDYTIFDIGTHKYMQPSFEYIKTIFKNINFELIVGDSIIKLPDWIEKNNVVINTYDVVHIDGGHGEECIKNDFINADKLVKLGGYIIIDDTNAPIINSYVDKYLMTNKYSEVDILPTILYPHRIIKKIDI
jgi:hypothetical protein